MTSDSRTAPAAVTAWAARVTPRRWRQVVFLLATVVVYLVDLFLTLASGEERTGHHWLAFGRWDVDVATYMIVLALVYSVLLLRRRWPMTVLTAMTVVTLALSYVSVEAQPVAGALLALYAAARTADGPRLARTALVLGVVAVAGPVALHPDRGSDAFVGSVIGATVAGGVWLFGRREQRAARDTAGLRVELARLQEQAVAEERRRIARELHDILAHSVSAMMMQAAGARAVARAIARDGQGGGPEGGQGDGQGDARWGSVEAALTSVETTGSQSMRELQRLLGALHQEGPVEREVVSSPPGMDAVDELVRITRSSGLVVEVHQSGRPRDVDWSVGLAGYRVLQEALANAMKHAGHGAVVDVFISWGTDELQLQVRCRPGPEGFRPDVAEGGHGLVGLRERVELVGGRFDAGWVGEEFVTTADLPLTAPPEAVTSSPTPASSQAATSSEAPASSQAPASHQAADGAGAVEGGRR
ncbi:histidine kinase [Ornithinimicrobium kibberense]|uniref:histidine kinase n=2 Tax=Ornithinimicrobium kibberense TaxID=282060 RepID=A0ABV5V684_9MICO|nr:histidine kinase [Ornithinimicrobium kibberense]